MWCLGPLVDSGNSCPQFCPLSLFVYYPVMRQFQQLLKSCPPLLICPGQPWLASAQTLIMTVDFTGQKLWLHHKRAVGFFFKSMDSKEEMNMCNHWKSPFLEQSVVRNQVCSDSGLLSGMYRKLPQINKRKTRNPMGSEQLIDQEITEEKSEWLTSVWRDAQP